MRRKSTIFKKCLLTRTIINIRMKMVILKMHLSQFYGYPGNLEACLYFAIRHKSIASSHFVLIKVGPNLIRIVGYLSNVSSFPMPEDGLYCSV